MGAGGRRPARPSGHNVEVFSKAVLVGSRHCWHAAFVTHRLAGGRVCAAFRPRMRARKQRGLPWFFTSHHASPGAHSRLVVRACRRGRRARTGWRAIFPAQGKRTSPRRSPLPLRLHHPPEPRRLPNSPQSSSIFPYAPVAFVVGSGRARTVAYPWPLLP